MVSLLLMCFLLHMVGCFFAVAANISEDFGLTSWVIENDLTESSIIQKYLACIYWAAVSISTVGYGDILPTNTIEITVEILLVFTGVALYSYIISKLSNLFSSVKKDDSDKTRDEILSEFAMMQSFSDHLKKKI